MAVRASFIAALVLASLPMASAYALGGDVPRAALPFKASLTREARLIWGLNAPVATFAGQIHQESAWNPHAVSPAGARGMAQFMPATARWICGAYDLDGCDTSNPRWAMRALITYDRHLFERTPKSGDECGRMWAALRGYNGGLGHWMDEWIKAGRPADLRDADAACGSARRSRQHCPENLGYPRRIIETHQPRYVSAGWGRGVCE